MKNKEIIFVIGIILVSLIIIYTLGKSDNNIKNESNEAQSILEKAEHESKKVKEKEQKDFKMINLATYLEYYTSDEDILVLLARPTCHYCQIAEPILKNLAYKYDIEINYLNTDDFTEEDNNNLMASDEFFSSGYGTPILLYIKNNSIIDKVDGLTNSDGYIEFLRTNGFIK